MSLRVRLLGATAYVLVLAMIAFGVPLTINLIRRVNAEVRTQARTQADLVAATAADLLNRGERAELGTLAQTAASSIRGRVLIVNTRGRVLVDSAGAGQIGASYRTRPELQAALRGGVVQLARSSKTLGQEILATAAPIIRGGRPAGAVRITQSVAAVNHAVSAAELRLGLVGLVVLVLGLAAGAVLAAHIAGPLHRMEAVARRVAQGDLGARTRVEGSREQRSLALSFNGMTERLGRLLRVQRDFVADASHQLRTPLTGLRLRLEEARAASAEPRTVEELDAAMAEVDRLARTVDDLLVLSRAGERQREGARILLQDFGRDAAERWRKLAATESIRLEHRASDGEASTWASRADLDRAIDALLENAVHYSPAGGTVTILTSLGRVSVVDRGPGIPREERALVFERFRRGQTGKLERPGSGLGLSIARELIRAWGGEIQLADNPDGGTVATLLLPLDGSAADGVDDAAFQSVNPSPSSVGAA